MSAEYKMFHGKAPRRVDEIDLHVPRRLIRLGRAVAVEYECSKRNGGGTGKPEIFRHTFGKGTILCMDETKRHQLYIIGDKLKVTEAGIEK